MVSAVASTIGIMAGSLDTLLATLRASVQEITPAAAAEASGVVWLDVREPGEVATGTLPGAITIPRGQLEMSIDTVLPDREQSIVVYCAAGTRSLLAADTLQRLGYRNVQSLAGGISRWKAEGHPVVQHTGLSPEELQRYDRHILIPEVGVAGQQRLLASRVLIVGAGGLGAPVAYYLAAAGVGSITLIDSDTVDVSNLQRQILHTPGRVGQPKVDSARQTLLAFNPSLQLTTYQERLTSTNVEALVSGADVIVDGTDNFPTRFLLSDACLLLSKPLVYGAVFRFEGQVSVFHPAAGGPCYRCLYPSPPPPELAPNCAEAGVLGVLPGVIGLLQATESLKLLLGVGEPLIGRLCTYDALSGRFRELRQDRDPGCAYCAPGTPFPGFIDYEAFCAATVDPG